MTTVDETPSAITQEEHPSQEPAESGEITQDYLNLHHETAQDQTTTQESATETHSNGTESSSAELQVSTQSSSDQVPYDPVEHSQDYWPSNYYQESSDVSTPSPTQQNALAAQHLGPIPGGINLFINSLPPDLDDNGLYKLFQPFGDIISSKVMIDVATGKSRCFGFVKFKDMKVAQNAIEKMNGEMIGGKKLVVTIAESKGALPTASGTPSPNLYIKGLPLTMSDEHLTAMFSPYGTVVHSKILKDPATGMSRGLGFVTFDNIQQGEYAITNLNGYIFPGTVRGICVRFADTEEEKQTRKLKQQRRFGGSNRFVPYHPGMAPVQPVAPPAAAPYPYPYVAQPTDPYAMYGGYYPPQYGYGYPQPVMEPQPPTTPNYSNQLFVFHLPSSANEELLTRLFSTYGPVLSARVATDPNTGQCKGYGFVTMSDWTTAAAAIQGLHGHKLDNKHLSVSYKK